MSWRGLARVPVFPVSSRWSLEAQGRDDTSGMAELREALSAFLAAERTGVLLEMVTERALRLLAAEREDLALAERAASSSDDARRVELVQAHAECERLHRQLAERMARRSRRCTPRSSRRGSPNLNATSTRASSSYPTV
jgi:hypothetical protein